MYKIAICDDEKVTCTELTRLLQRSAEMLQEQFEICSFSNGEELLEKLDEGMRFDFLFLDIHLQMLNGVEVGKHIREELRDYKTLIVYISSDQSYAMTLFQVQPFDFLVKPLQEETVHRVVKKGICQLADVGQFLEYQKNKSLCRVNFDELLYIHSDRKKIVLVQTGQKEEEFYGKLRDMIPKLPANFTQISQSYVINRNYVQRYSYEEVLMMNRQTLLISKAYRKAIREMILTDWKKG